MILGREFQICSQISEFEISDRIYLSVTVKKKDVLVIRLLQETKNSDLYNKNCIQNVKNRMSNAIFNMKNVDLDESLPQRNCAGSLSKPLWEH